MAEHAVRRFLTEPQIFYKVIVMLFVFLGISASYTYSHPRSKDLLELVFISFGISSNFIIIVSWGIYCFVYRDTIIKFILS